MHILITGSSGFIGNFLKTHLSEKHEIIEFDINPDSKNVINACKEKEVINFFSLLPKKYANIDMLINCLGVPDSANKLLFKDLIDVDLESFTKLIDINLTSIFVIIREFVRNYPHCQSNIINISSLYSVVSPRLDIYSGNIKHPGYIASKFGLVGLTRYLAVLVAKHNMKINCIAPAAVKETLGVDGEFLQKYNQQVPLKRPVEMNDILDVVNMLTSNKNITGQNLIIDGGYTLW